MQEGGVKGAADRLIATEAEGYVGHAAADLAAGAQPLDLARCPDRRGCMIQTSDTGSDDGTSRGKF